MNGTEKQDFQPTTSIYLPVRHRKMASSLIKNGHYKTLSEIARAGIERIFNEEFVDPREELRQERFRLQEVIKELEALEAEQDTSKDSLISRYAQRKENMPARAMGNYEKFSKNWITKNLDDASSAFPGKTVDEIYEELEKAIKRNVDGKT